MPTKLVARFPYEDKDIIIYQDIDLNGREITPPYGEGHYTTTKGIRQKQFVLRNVYPGIGIEGMGEIDFILPLSSDNNQIRWHCNHMSCNIPEGPVSTLIKKLPWYGLVAQLNYGLQQTGNIKAPQALWETVERLMNTTNEILQGLETWAIEQSKEQEDENKN